MNKRMIKSLMAGAVLALALEIPAGAATSEGGVWFDVFRDQAIQTAEHFWVWLKCRGTIDPNGTCEAGECGGGVDPVGHCVQAPLPPTGSRDKCGGTIDPNGVCHP